jgi:hypothetical protein
MSAALQKCRREDILRPSKSPLSGQPKSPISFIAMNFNMKIKMTSREVAHLGLN